MFTADQVVRVASGYASVVESPYGSNRTIIGQKFGWNGVAWCAEFVCVCWAEAGFGEVHTAAVSQLMEMAKAGHAGLRWSDQPVVGAACCFDWKGRRNPNDMHTGITADFRSRSSFHNWEGNYQNRVGYWFRNDQYVMGWAVPPLAISQPTPTEPPKPSRPKGVGMDWIVQIPGEPHWYITDWKTVAHIVSGKVAQEIINQCKVRGVPIVCNAKMDGPLVLDAASLYGDREKADGFVANLRELLR